MNYRVGKASVFTFRPQIGSVTLCILTTAYLLAVTNTTFWIKAHGYLADTSPLAFGLFALGISAMCLAILTLFSAKYLVKPVLIFLVITASLSSWFTDQFGTIIDREMIRNAAVSTGAETAHLLTPRFLMHVVLTGLLPSLLIVWLRVRHRPFLSKLAHNAGIIIACVAVFAAAGFSDYRTFAGVGRAHNDILDRLNPFLPIANAARYTIDANRDRNIVAQPIGTDAHRINTAAITKPRVTVIVAGETARAANFSLGGYDRDTNPQLKARGVTYFSNTTSCGTATAVSIPCMFSDLTRASYSHRKAAERQNLLDVLGYAKVSVTWLDNDTGHYNVADRVPYTFLPPSADPRFCKDGECLDGILTDKLNGWLDGIKGDSVLVLHQLGSHGPAYYARYPEEFRRFQPDCRANDFGKCSPQEIRNAYDNTILYTDHIVAEVIDALKQRSATLTGAVVYLSDHGESLGENGIYLHGMPYMVAPTEQTHVPLLFWLADDLAQDAGYDRACLAKTTAEPHSHDNLFHSVLGLMDVATKVYNPALDVFSGCRRAPGTVAAAEPVK
ncbi:phosphoethanolamine transferase [Agrobacterium vitis]|uniref:phosphoethanolamine transferase n=1 Tax=Agrobacterium vitis TaxID=373 RepID=UPI00087343EF|nr:phosphoethanolamine--lipid A transferase [Agrobacterium vitis]MCE6074727.1 phosphoethanolamine--lipid A transferase [Agrobacterium vitis]MCM2467868.1 phosphoethanolamine--lipid A transferase [Agrobacterium vitis]MUO68227.1 phosphoethanolamine--lipid A transferase [Agrobacterium vitis]MUO83555.1 phosphoethanolamine--lipid A transferase [Agrobacterium vitis]